MTNLVLTVRGLDGNVIPNTQFKVSPAFPDDTYNPETSLTEDVLFTTDSLGVASLSLPASTNPYYVTRAAMNTDGMIAYKLFVPATAATLTLGMVYVDLKSQLKLTNDKALYTMVESKVSMLVALEQAKTASTAAGLNASLVSADKAIIEEAKDAVLAVSGAIKPRYFGGIIHAAHRGYAAHSIENTMTSFSKAIQYRADALELDVQISSDGVPVVIHDSTVDYSTTSSGNVKDFTAAELKAMTRDARYGAIYEKSYIPTFAEVVALAKTHQIQIWPEVKGYRTIDDIALMVQVVKDAGYEHMTKFQSFNFVDMPVVRSLSSIVSLGYTNGADDFRTYASSLLGLGGECWIVTSIAKASTHPDYVKQLQDMGIRVAVYTAYLSSDVIKAEKAGVDAIICDRHLRGVR